VLRKPR